LGLRLIIARRPGVGPAIRLVQPPCLDSLRSGRGRPRRLRRRRPRARRRPRPRSGSCL